MGKQVILHARLSDDEDEFLKRTMNWCAENGLKVDGKNCDLRDLDRTDFATGFLKYIHNTKLEDRPEALRFLLSILKIVNGGKKPISINMARDGAEAAWGKQ